MTVLGQIFQKIFSKTKNYVCRNYSVLKSSKKNSDRFSPYIILKANKDDYSSILKVMHEIYYHNEPTCLTLDIKPNTIMDETILKNMAEGMTLVARCKYDGCIVGAAVNETSNVWDPELKEKLAYNIQCPKMKQWLLFQAHVQRFPQLWSNYGVNKIFEVSNIFIRKVAREREILIRLLKESRSLANDLGYSVVRVNATNNQIGEICEKLNMELSAEIPFYSNLAKGLEEILKPTFTNKSVKIYVDVNTPKDAKKSA